MLCALLFSQLAYWFTSLKSKRLLCLFKVLFCLLVLAVINSQKNAISIASFIWTDLKPFLSL